MTRFRNIAAAGLAVAMVFALAACPPVPPIDDPQNDYDEGFNDGFLEDDWYWDGFFDSFDSVDATYYYDDSEIPYLESPAYDAGYWDGVWYAYNDGYFTSYRYAFIVGFSEGYDNAYASDYLNFLATDDHLEYLTGGFGDGYNDGFSEGRVFGANDYEQGLTFDWLGALLDYESGTDLYFEEVDVGTGVYGPVYLYEYGVHPADYGKSTADKRPVRKELFRSLRADTSKARDKDVNVDDYPLFRDLSPQAQTSLSVTPETSERNDRNLRLDTSWLDRIDAYTDAGGEKTASETLRNRAVVD